jgi:hypothetical protein
MKGPEVSMVAELEESRCIILRSAWHLRGLPAGSMMEGSPPESCTPCLWGAFDVGLIADLIQTLFGARLDKRKRQIGKPGRLPSAAAHIGSVLVATTMVVDSGSSGGARRSTNRPWQKIAMRRST